MDPKYILMMIIIIIIIIIIIMMMILIKRDMTMPKQLGVGSPSILTVYFWWLFYLINARKLWFHVSLLFHVRKHMASSFHLNWTKCKRNCEFCSNCGFPGTQTELEQIHNFLWIGSISVKIIRTERQKYSGCVPRDPFHA